MIRDCRPDQMPGFAPSPRREYIYVQSPRPCAFRQQFSTFGDGYQGELPVSGGMTNEEALIHIRVPRDVYLCGVSYKGDLQRWLALILHYCQREGLLHGTLDSNGVMLSDGTSVPWSDCVTMGDPPGT